MKSQLNNKTEHIGNGKEGIADAAKKLAYEYGHLMGQLNACYRKEKELEDRIEEVQAKLLQLGVLEPI